MTDAQQPADSPKPRAIPPEILHAPPIATSSESSGDVVPTDEAAPQSFHSDFAEFHEGYVSRYIELADTKAAWTFAIATGLLAYAFGSEKIGPLFSSPKFEWPFVVLLISACLLAASASFSFLVIVPRLSMTSEGIVYFGAVSRRKSAASYSREIRAKNEAELTNARLMHCYDLSAICWRKFSRLRAAIWTGVPPLVGILMLLLLT